jgi:hypothetical protein
MHTLARLPSKRDVLLFDRIALFHPSEHLLLANPETIPELAWPAERNIIFNASSIGLGRFDELPSDTASLLESTIGYMLAAVVFSHIADNPVVREYYNSPEKIGEFVASIAVKMGAYYGEVGKIASQFAEPLFPVDRRSPEELSLLGRDAAVKALDWAVRFEAARYQLHNDADVLPVVTNMPAAASANVSIATILTVTLNSLPVPDEGTPWEHIAEFRADEDAQRALRRLRRWMNGVARHLHTPRELADELQYLLDTYEEYMRLHRIKLVRGRLETVVTATAEAIENLASLRLSNAVKALFAVRQQHTALLESELEAPGREVAYIARARQAFSK